MVGGKSHVQLDKELLMCYSSPEQTEKEANKSWKSPCFPADEHRLQFRSSSVLLAKGPNVETCRRARRRNRRLSGTVQKPADVNMSLINGLFASIAQMKEMLVYNGLVKRDKCTITSQETFQQLQLQLEEQHETFQDLQKKWRNEFENGLSHFKEISSQFDSSQSYLKSISDNQKIAHQRLFSSMGEFVELHLNRNS
ncbi:hypothetical protein L7F22_022876 [Adiantum nelumboides]|nr:hypothetical protein [Adiantum nelumboides]